MIIWSLECVIWGDVCFSISLLKTKWNMATTWFIPEVISQYKIFGFCTSCSCLLLFKTNEAYFEYGQKLHVVLMMEDDRHSNQWVNCQTDCVLSSVLTCNETICTETNQKWRQRCICFVFLFEDEQGVLCCFTVCHVWAYVVKQSDVELGWE